MKTNSHWLWGLWLLGIAAAGAQALALVGFYFHADLSSDYLYPHLAAEDMLDGRYPLSGWTLSSAPYLFPDFAGCIAFLMLVGDDGRVFAAYVASYYTAVSIILGWAAARTRPDAGVAAWLVGPIVINVLLAWREVGDHARYLWWLGTPGFHGGAILMGMIQFALWVGPLDTAPTRVRRGAATILLFAGLLSDTLLFVQFVGPLLIAFMWSARGYGRIPVRLQAFARALVVAGLAVVVVRVALALAGLFTFSKVVRYAPWPTDIAAAGSRMARDFGETIVPNGGAFVALAAVCVLFALWRPRRAPAGSADALAGKWVVVVLLVTVTLPVVTVYWRDAQNARYLLPLLIVPAWWLGVSLVAWWQERERNARVIWVFGVPLALAFCAATGFAAGSWSREKFVWPQVPELNSVSDALRGRGLTHGFSDYWNCHRFNRLGSGVRLSPLRAEGRAYFWNNNAFWYFDADASGRMTRAHYSFILTTRLNMDGLEAKFGAPAERLKLGEEEIWIYSPKAAAAMSRLIESEVRQRLAGRPGAEKLPP